MYTPDDPSIQVKEAFMRDLLVSIPRFALSFILALLFLCSGSSPLLAQSCPAVATRPSSAGDTAYSEGRYAEAEGLYAAEAAQAPQNKEVAAALIRTLLREGKVGDASAAANAALAQDAHSPALLTALAEVQLRQGAPWLAMQSLDEAAAANRCYAREHLIRARILRIDSMYGAERAQIQIAHQIDAEDPDIQLAWRRILAPAIEIENIHNALATAKDIDEESRQKAVASAQRMMPLLYETSQTCQVVPTSSADTLPLIPSMPDGKHIDGYRLEVQLPQTKAELLVDTSASGLYISRALADLNGLKPGPDTPEGTVHVDSLSIGSLEFRNCMVGVSDVPFSGKTMGFVGTDIFAPWLVTLDFRRQKLMLDPLPPKDGVLPGDRLAPPDSAAWTKVFHRKQYLLVPVDFKGKSQKLLALSTGLTSSAMSSEAAHSVSAITVNFTNSLPTASGARVQIYRDVFEMKFADLPPFHLGHVAELDTAAMSHNAGFDIAGMLGLDALQNLTLHLDYRDGLVKFESAAPEVSSLFRKGASDKSSQVEQAECPPLDSTDLPLNATIEAVVAFGLDSGHLKPGKEIWLKAAHEEVFPQCRLEKDAALYGRVIETTSLKSPDSSSLTLVFDRADCRGHDKQPLPLRLIALVGPKDAGQNEHSVMPTLVNNRGREISDVAVEINGVDHDLSPGNKPGTVHPGIVAHLPGMKLEPQGGSGCNARIVAARRSVVLGSGAEFIFSIVDKP